MDESFVGHEANFCLPCDDSVVALLMSFLEELLLVGGSDVEAPEQVEEQIRVAIEEICSRRGNRSSEPPSDADSGAKGDLLATLTIVGEGVEVRLSSPRGGHELPAILVREE
jgi:hypothetical protein